MDSRRTASKSKSVATAEEDDPEHASTESQLSKLLAESRSEAESLRRELAAVKKKAEADHQHLQALLTASSNKPSAESAQIQRAYRDRISRAETALEDAQHRSRVVQRNWRLLDNYLGTVQHHAAASRAAFSRVIEQKDLVFSPGDLPPLLRHERPVSVPPPASSSRHRHHESPSPRDSDVYSRSLPPLLVPRHPIDMQSPNDLEEEHWDGREDGPPYKRRRSSASQSPEISHFSPQQPRGYANPQTMYSPAHSSGHRPRSPYLQPLPSRRYEPHEMHDVHRSRHPQPPSPVLPRLRPRDPRDSMPPPPPASLAPYPDARTPPPLRPMTAHTSTNAAYDAHEPPLQIIQHRHPLPPPAPTVPPPQSPPPPRQTSPFQHQHRFHAGPGTGSVARRVVRPGAYETVVFALDQPGLGSSTAATALQTVMGGGGLPRILNSDPAEPAPSPVPRVTSREGGIHVASGRERVSSGSRSSGSSGLRDGGASSSSREQDQERGRGRGRHWDNRSPHASHERGRER